MRVFLHIGAEKTGTSSIQEFLLQNREVLLEHGYCYLHMAGRNEYRDLPAYCMNQDVYDGYFKRNFINNREARLRFDDRFINEFQLKMQQLPSQVHTVIISSEHLSSWLRSFDEVQRLRQLLSAYASDFNIFYYIRSQADKVISAYSTAIKSGGSLCFEDYFKRFLDRYDNDYDQVLQLWETVFGKHNIRVRLFDRKAFVNGDLLQDFISSFDADLFKYMNGQISVHNRSLSSSGIFLARYINKLIPVFNEKKGINNLNRTLIKFIATHDIGKPIKLNQKYRHIVLQHYELSNETVRMKYFPERDVLFRTE